MSRGLALILLSAVIALGWACCEWAEELGPYIETTELSPGGDYTVYRESRVHFNDLETRVSIEVFDQPGTRTPLLPWSRDYFCGFDWTGPRQLTIDMPVESGEDGSTMHGSWRDLRYTLLRH